MSKANIEYAAKRANSVRKLKRTSRIIHEAKGSTPAILPREIIAGLVTIDGKCTRSIISDTKKLSKMRFLDFGCSLAGDSFWYLRGDKGYMRDLRKLKLETGDNQNGLIHFFLRLLTELQKSCNCTSH